MPPRRALETAHGGAVLLVASERGEFAGILRRCRNIGHPGWPLDFSACAELDGRPVLLLANGPGAELASDAVKVGCSRAPVRAIVSTGYCGALDPALASGEIFVASRVEAPQLNLSYRAEMPSTALSFRVGCLFSLGRVVRTTGEKARLRAAGASAVEMEAVGVAAEADRVGLPFFCIRAVLDRAGEGFTLDFDALKRADGRFDRLRIAGQALVHPRVLPELVRIHQGCRRASRALGDFFGDCRFSV